MTSWCESANRPTGRTRCATRCISLPNFRQPRPVCGREGHAAGFRSRAPDWAGTGNTGTGGRAPRRRRGMWLHLRGGRCRCGSRPDRCAPGRQDLCGAGGRAGLAQPDGAGGPGPVPQRCRTGAGPIGLPLHHRHQSGLPGHRGTRRYHRDARLHRARSERRTAQPGLLEQRRIPPGVATTPHRVRTPGGCRSRGDQHRALAVRRLGPDPGRPARAAARPARSLPARGAAASRPPRDPEVDLVYPYWGEVDSAGHEQGWRSQTWGEELAHLDTQLQRLDRLLPAGTLLIVTADHGMVDVPADSRIDVAEHAQLLQDVDLIGGEPRAVHVYTRPGKAENVVRRWGETLGERARVLSRAALTDTGLLGPVARRHEAAIGDVVVIA